MKIDLFYPSVLNDPLVHEKLFPTALDIFNYGFLQVKPLLGGEDFAFYSRKVPSMFYFIGAKAEVGEAFVVHHPKVVFNEDCIRLGSEFLSQAALQLLE